MTTGRWKTMEVGTMAHVKVICQDDPLFFFFGGDESKDQWGRSVIRLQYSNGR
jgi:hypothetical protein